MVPRAERGRRVALAAVAAAALAAAAGGVAVARSSVDAGFPHALQLVLLTPFCALAAGALAARAAGLATGVAAAAAFALGPLAAEPLFDPRYRGTWKDVVAPELVAAGTALTAVAAAAAAAAAVAAVELLARDRRLAGAVAAATAAAVAAAAAVAVAQDPAPAQITRTFASLDEYFWSPLIVLWAAVAGTFALARRAPLAALVTAAWFWPTALVAAASGGWDEGVPWQALAPAAPAFAVLLASLPLLVPRARAAPAREGA